MTAVITHSVVSGAAANPDVDVDGPAWDAAHVITGVMSPSQGGTGVANNDSSTLTISGAFGTTFTVTATTSLTLPTTGTLATTSNKLSDFAATTSAELKTVISDETGSGALVFATSPTLVTPVLGTPASGTLTNCTGLPLSTGISGAGTGVLTALAVNVGSAGSFVVNGGVLGTPSSGTLTNATGLPISTGVSGLGTGIATALAVNTGSAGAPVLFNGALGTPSSGTLTNATGLPVSTGISGLGTGVATFLATPSSANLATAITDETGSGSLVFATSPTLVAPALGTPASGTLTNCTGLPISSGVSGLGTGIATFLATPSSANLASAVTNETGSGALVFATSPTLVTPALGTPASGTLTNCTGLPVSTGISGLGTGVATFLATPSSANLASAITDETGGGVLVFHNSPQILTPSIVGVTDASSATAGNVGEYITASVAFGSAVSLTNATAANITSMSLTAGDWDVWINARFTGGATTTVTRLLASISTTSATTNTTVGRIANFVFNSFTVFNTADMDVPCGPVQINISSTTTVYFVALANFAVSTCSGYGIIHARRRR